VPDGAVLLVRPGNYLSFTIAGKSLRILGEPGVVVHPAGFTLSGTPYAISGNGNVRYDPSVVMSTPMFAPGITATSMLLPRIAASFAGAVATCSSTANPASSARSRSRCPGRASSCPASTARSGSTARRSRR
jgi:hypothetical protein